MSSLEFNCPVCLEPFESNPKLMPCCGETICFKCTTFIANKFCQASNYECPVCKHLAEFPPKKKFPTNNLFLKLLNDESKNELDFKLSLLDIKTKELNEAYMNGVDKIKKVCDFTRNEIDVKTESTIDLIYKYRIIFEEEVDKYENETLEAFEKNKTERANFENLINELNEFLIRFKEENNIKDFTNRLNVIKHAQYLEAKLKMERENLNNLIFNGKVLTFNGNNRLNPTILGCLTYNLKDLKMKYHELNIETYQKITFDKVDIQRKNQKLIIADEQSVFIVYVNSKSQCICSLCTVEQKQMTINQTNTITAVNTMYFSKVKLFKFSNRFIVYTLKWNGYYYIDIFATRNLEILFTINLGSFELEWISANDTHLFCLGLNSKILIYDWNQISQLNYFNSDFLNSIPSGATQMDIYENMFAFKCKNKILILNRDGKIVSSIYLTDEIDENFLIDSVNNRVLILNNKQKVLMDYSLDMEIECQIKLNRFPDDLKMFLSKNSKFLFLSEHDLCVYV